MQASSTVRADPMPAEVLLPLALDLGEGALAIAEDDSFLFVDIHAGHVFAGDLRGTSSLVASYDHTVGSVAVATDGGVIVAGRHRIDEVNGPFEMALPDQQPDIRMNDAKADPLGRFVCGTMAEPPRPGAGALWSFSAGGVHEVIGDVTISNGLCWSADGATLFYVDTPTQRIDCLDYDLATGTASNRRTWTDIEPKAGAPDGMTIDDEGGLWVALWGGAAVHRYLDGRLDHVVDVPTPFVTSTTIVGETLVITSAAEPTTGDSLAGHVFCADIGIGAPLPHAVDLEALASVR